MQFDIQTTEVLATRNPGDRRCTPTAPPPYLSEDGFVLFERREERRRNEAHSSPNQ
jgi:hypothetical protein